MELFNYGAEPVNLNGWTISDEGIDTDVISDTDLILSPGDYLVIAKNKAALEGAFFGGVANDAIVEVPGLTLGNSADEIAISDAESNAVWSLAYPNGDSAGRAVFLSEDSFTTTMWGSTATPGIDQTGIDPASGTLGYQNNDATEDPNATTSGDDTASPLAGFYTSGSTPEPGDDGFRILSIVPSAAAGSFDITFTSELGASYSLDISTDLTSFTDVAPVVGADGTTTVTTFPGLLTRAFYRIRETTVIIDP